MKKKFAGILVLISILFFAFFIYMHKLNEIPSGFYVDEASVAYNAYSIMKTGKDEFGKSFPVLFRLFGSYSPPLFVYLSVPFIYFFGMDPFSFRLISVFSAIVSLVVLYKFLRKLSIFKRDWVIYLIVFFCSICPWLVFNARLGYEVTLGYLIFNVGLYFLYRALKEAKYYLLGPPVLSFSIYASHNQRYLFPLFVVLYLIFFRKIVFQKKNLRYLFWGILITVIVQVPNIILSLTPAFWVKNATLGDRSFIQIVNDASYQFLNYYSPKSLFYFLPDIDAQHTIPLLSVMYNWMVIPYLIGLYLLFAKVKENSHKFIILLFFSVTIPASLAGHFISIQRVLPFLLPLIVVIGLGIDWICQKVSLKIVVPAFLLLSVYSLLMLYRSYFVLFPVERAEGWNYGLRQLSQYISVNSDKHFVIDNYNNPRLYVELLYFLRYPPEKFQVEIGDTLRKQYYQAPKRNLDFSFSNIEVRPVNWEKDLYKEQIIVGNDLLISEKEAEKQFLTKTQEFFFPDGRVAFRSYKANPEKKCESSKILKEPISHYCQSVENIP